VILKQKPRLIHTDGAHTDIANSQESRSRCLASMQVLIALMHELANEPPAKRHTTAAAALEVVTK
jgi:hypothetical protein